MVWVLHSRSGGATYGGQKLIILSKKGVEERQVKLKMSEAHSISVCLEVRAGGKKA